MRSVLTLGLLIALCSFANAATVRHSRLPERHVPPSQPITMPKSYVVPGWTEEQTRRWLNDATGPKD
jgi:hypothetical protein